MEKAQPKSLATRSKEISLLIEYGAPKDEVSRCNEVLAKYGADGIALNVFHNFYSYLPEGHDDGITRISRIANRHGAFLFYVSTILSNYLYLATRESASLIGPFNNTIQDQDLLDFFGWQDDDHFRKDVGEPAELSEHVPVNESLELCPACGTSDGEVHTFGCPVEVCPWCDGQLTNCECRFIKTGREQFSRDSHLDELLDLLTEKGRIPFAADQHRPSFMKDENIELDD
ncbi:MAG: hypothetical protein ABFS18_14545 [Thermodesulfobacteriota bacterium]